MSEITSESSELGESGQSQERSVLISIDETTGVGIITLNRPARRNALDHQMLPMLDEAVSDFASNDSVRAVAAS